jgi:apolipoprotein N-acyltransferase
MNPLVPSALDGVLMTASLVALIMALVALISVLRVTFRSWWRQLAWVLVVLIVPYIGPLAWFVARRRERSLKLGHGVDGS